MMSDDIKESLCVELEHVFCQFPEYHMNISLEDFDARIKERKYFQTDTGAKLR